MAERFPDFEIQEIQELKENSENQNAKKNSIDLVLCLVNELVKGLCGFLHSKNLEWFVTLSLLCRRHSGYLCSQPLEFWPVERAFCSMKSFAKWRT